MIARMAETDLPYLRFSIISAFVFHGRLRNALTERCLFEFPEKVEIELFRIGEVGA